MSVADGDKGAAPSKGVDLLGVVLDVERRRDGGGKSTTLSAPPTSSRVPSLRS